MSSWLILRVILIFLLLISTFSRIFTQKTLNYPMSNDERLREIRPNNSQAHEILAFDSLAVKFGRSSSQSFLFPSPLN